MSRALAMLLALGTVLPGATAAAQTFTRVSIGPGGTQPNGRSASPSISADGRFVAFESTATNLVAGDANDASDIFGTRSADGHDVAGERDQRG